MADTWQNRIGKAGVGAEPNMDVRRAMALIRVMNETRAKLQNLDRDKDPKTFDIHMLMLMNLTEQIGKVPAKVLTAAQEGISQQKKDMGEEFDTADDADPEDLDFEQLQAVFNQYRQAKTPEEVLEYLSVFHGLAVTWINDHKLSKNGERVDVVYELRGWAEKQILSGAKAQAGQIYLNDILGTGKAPLQAISTTSAKGVKDHVVGKGEQGGLSEAQIAAFRIFSGPDYGYINPAADRSTTWLQANKLRADTGKAFEEPRDPTPGEEDLDAIRMVNEGPLHAGFLNDALKSLPPYEGTVYRGWGIDQKELDAIKATGKYEFRTPTSTSKLKAVARSFANTRPEKPIEVFATIVKSSGRDTSKHSAVQMEAEVTIPAGTRFNVTEIEKVGGQTRDGGDRYAMSFTGPG